MTKPKPSGNEIREMFLRFFESKGHRRVRSSSLVPHGDPTLLFTNAGMNQFKDVFLGLEKRDYSTATTAQKCVRAGGKHNDLENVGFTKRHHTFFEMLGNFSFGDYFKEKAIPYAWELVTSPEWYGIAKEKLYVTVFGGAEVAPGTTLGVDEDARKIWLEQNVPAERVVPVPGLKDNFWAMGDTGPCGPCSEIFYDMGVEASEEGHTDCKFPCDCGRYVEIWNLVFMQFNRVCLRQEFERGALDDTIFPYWDPRLAEGARQLEANHTHGSECLALKELPRPSVDTGMGLERTAAVLQGVISNYDTDLFVPLMKRAAELCGVDFNREEKLEEGKGGAASLRVIADHARATTFLITDGVVPDRGDRGGVLRKIMLRATRHALLLGAHKPILADLVPQVSDLMGKAYPELLESVQQVTNLVEKEESRLLRSTEKRFRTLEERISDIRRIDMKGIENYFAIHDDNARTALEQRMQFLRAERNLANASDEQIRSTTMELFGPDFAPEVEQWVRETASKAPVIKGEVIFQLYDTYGVPLDLIEEAARDEGFDLDLAGFERALEEQRRRAREASHFADAHIVVDAGGQTGVQAKTEYQKLAETFRTEKDFYHGTCAKDCRIEAIISTGGPQRGDATGGATRASGKSGPVNELKPGESGEVVLDRTVIYAESGGQMADTGAIYDASQSLLLGEVTGAYYPVAGLIAHKVTAKETLRVGDRITVVADCERRARIIRNHSGTHLVHAALRNILGTHVKQAGSLNSPERLRFDFSHFAHVDPEELRDIEQQVNDEIRHNTQIETNITSLDDALASGALAFFGDKYPESNVRVVTIPDERAPRGFYSKELCGGTHVHRIGDIGVLKIVSEGSVAAGVRRIEAVTGIGALEHYEQQAKVLSQVASQLNVGEDAVLASVEKLANTVKTLEKELESQKRKGALGQLDSLASQVQTIKGVKVVAAEVTGTDREGLRQLVDSLRQKIGSGVVALGMPEDGKVALIAGVTKDLTAKVHAGKMIQTLSAKLGGKGGGRPDLAEGGGTDTAALKSALSTIPAYLEPLL